ncbi:SufD family Fe-S cluster assembly protein [Candidatus Berkelbacteria bacterium]|nr:SufD family Fe-S cluster assembly protein [Candidatus Berkelbacteria bacterium]
MKNFLRIQARRNTFVLEKAGEYFLPISVESKSDSLSLYVDIISTNVKLIIISTFLGKAQDNFQFDIQIHHRAPKTQSDIKIFAALFEMSQLSVNGAINLPTGVKNSSTYFFVKSLLLSDKARTRVIPSLGIEENEVRAGHGVSIGRISDEELFYLMSRGLTQAQAQNLLVQSLFEPAREKIREYGL